MLVKATDVSANKKLGPIPSAMADSGTCPPSCKLALPLPGRKAPPCYGMSGPISMHWRNLDAGKGRVLDPEQFASWVGTLPVRALWRDRVVGDQMPEAGNRERIDAPQFRKVIRANKRRKARGFGFTHYPMTDAHNRALILEGYDNVYVLNASTDNMREAHALKTEHTALSVVTLAPSDYSIKDQTIDGVRFVMCPNAWDKRITCQRCQLCAKPGREVVIVFPGHGTAKRSIDIIARAA